MPLSEDEQLRVAGMLGREVVEIKDELRLEVDVDGRRHTVELRHIEDFEDRIIEDLIDENRSSNVTGAAVPIKGRWIANWLAVRDEDYINNIWKSYQFFIKYLESRTNRIENISTFKRSPGTYDSMYRYLLLLEELDLLERYRREQVPEDEYDFPVPEEFRTRTFIRLKKRFSDAPDEWRNPYKALYGERIEEDEEFTIEVEPVEETVEPEEGEGPKGLDELVEREEEEEEIPVEPTEPEEELEEEEAEEEPEESGPRGIDKMLGEEEEPEEEEEEPESDEIEMPEEGASITDFPFRSIFVQFMQDNMNEAVEFALDQSPVPAPDIKPDNYSLGRVAVFGPWAEGEATPGETELSMVVSIDDSEANKSPGFIPAGVQTALQEELNQSNPFEDIFPDYVIVSIYDSAFHSKLSEVVSRTQTEREYYDLTDSSFKSI